jgi:hypothetical protein
MKHVRNIVDVCELRLFLPDSVYKHNEFLVISDSGNNRVCILDTVNNTEFQICGELGLGKYKLKEPVYASIDERCIYVCDWHNHRVVVYDLTTKNYLYEIGIFGRIADGVIKSAAKKLKNMMSSGTFLTSHFLANNTERSTKIFDRIGFFFEAAHHYVFNSKTIDFRVRIAKPNGCVVVDDVLVFTQKDNSMVSSYDLKKGCLITDTKRNFSGIDSGRLGQVSVFNKLYYVCDETNNLVWILNKELQLESQVSLTSYNIFSISVNDKYIATCGVSSFSIFDHTHTLLFESEGEGEYHGVHLDDEVLFVVNRFKNRVEVYEFY